MYHPSGQKFAQNRSISYGKISFSFSAKIQDGRRKWRKLKFSPFVQETLVPPCGFKNSFKIALSLTVFEVLDTFSFSAKIQDGQKFARNHSISYGFRDIDPFSFSAKIQDGHRKWRKLKFSPFAQETVVPPYWSKIRSKSLYLLRFSRY